MAGLGRYHCRPKFEISRSRDRHSQHSAEMENRYNVCNAIPPQSPSAVSPGKSYTNFIK
ncbi:hypothetical protein IQ252_22650 [Tychonema sp. LEGE 07203]|nr:hypothetical protein [Tychonema sp. LEGE 07203]